MTDRDLEPKQVRAPRDPGRARQRKLKREGTTLPSNNAIPPARKTKTVRQSTKEAIKSTRERLVDEKIKLPSVSIPHIPEDLSLRKLPGAKKLFKEDGHQKTDANIRPGSRSSRRNVPKRTENLYEASPRTETQRKTDIRPGPSPRINRRTYDARSEGAPPVMVRGGLGGMAFGRVASSKLNKHKAPKRRIDVPLSITGAEVRLPSIPLVHIGWRAVSLLMVLMMAASLVLIWKAPAFRVATMKAEGLQRLTITDLNAVMKISGKSIFTINPTAVDSALQRAFPELSKISVKINLPADVKVVVDERQPVIAWVQDGKETWVDADGVSFPARGTISDTLVKVEGYGTPPGLIQGIPTAVTMSTTGEMTATTTLTPTLRLSSDLVSAILSLGAKMPPDTLLVYDSEHGLGWNDPKGWDVFFGSDDKDMEMKLTVYQSLVERLESQGIQPALISVEYVHAPYYRMER